MSLNSYCFSPINTLISKYITRHFNTFFSFFFKAQDVLCLHQSSCPRHQDNHTPRANLSLDGVQESNSSNTSIDIYCINFHGCKCVYPLRLIRPNERFKYNEQEEIYNVVSNMNEANIIINTGIFDNPKRSVVTMKKNHASKFPCEYCEYCAVSYINDTMKRRKLTWPPWTMNGRPRTTTGIRRIVNMIEEHQEGEPPLNQDDLKGIKGRSVLLDQPNYDIVLDTPTEYMHIVCLGIVKKMLELTYKIGQKRPRVTTRPRTDPKLFNDIICSVKVVREFSRRCRNLDPAVFKAQEYRNTLLFFFPIVLENIPELYKKERQLWLSLVFMIRSCVIPNEEFSCVNKESIVQASELFYNIFYEVYGQQNCIYSLHVVSSHLLKMRGNVPLTERSAFIFESFYSEMKNLFQPGTSSPLKQILQNTLMKRQLECHKCEKTILYTIQNEKQSLEDNSLIYTFENNMYAFYVITSIEEHEFTCKKQGKFEFKSELLPNFDWKTIGVFKKGPTGSDFYKVKKNEVKGKIISVLNMLITCPINVLRET